jgi:hypothetical protein
VPKRLPSSGSIENAPAIGSTVLPHTIPPERFRYSTSTFGQLTEGHIGAYGSQRCISSYPRSCFENPSDAWNSEKLPIFLALLHVEIERKATPLKL